MKKILAGALILSMLSTTGAMCFAEENLVSVTNSEIVSDVELVEELKTIVNEIDDDKLAKDDKEKVTNKLKNKSKHRQIPHLIQIMILKKQKLLQQLLFQKTGKMK